MYVCFMFSILVCYVHHRIYIHKICMFVLCFPSRFVMFITAYIFIINYVRLFYVFHLGLLCSSPHIYSQNMYVCFMFSFLVCYVHHRIYIHKICMFVLCFPSWFVMFINAYIFTKYVCLFYVFHLGLLCSSPHIYS